MTDKVREGEATGRGTIFGREAINRNQLLRALTVDGQDKVRLDDIQTYVNKSQKQAQHLGWYKFAALFGFIIIILQCFTTFGVAMWANTSSWGSHTNGGTLNSNDGMPIVATGFTPSEMAIEDIYASLMSGGVSIDKLSGEMANDNGDVSSFNFEIVGSVCALGCTLYTNTEATIFLMEETATVTIGDAEFSLMTVETRRRLAAGDGLADRSTYGSNYMCPHPADTLLDSSNDANFGTYCGQCLAGGGTGTCLSFSWANGNVHAVCSGGWAQGAGDELEWANFAETVALNAAFCPSGANCMEGRVGADTSMSHWRIAGQHICDGLGFSGNDADCAAAVTQMNVHDTNGPQSGCFVDDGFHGEVSQDMCNSGAGYCKSTSPPVGDVEYCGQWADDKEGCNAQTSGTASCVFSATCDVDWDDSTCNWTCTVVPPIDNECAAAVSESGCNGNCEWVDRRCNIDGCTWKSQITWQDVVYGEHNHGFVQLDGKEFTWVRHTKTTCGQTPGYKCGWLSGGMNVSTRTFANSESACAAEGGSWKSMVAGKCCYYGSD